MLARTPPKRNIKHETKKTFSKGWGEWRRGKNLATPLGSGKNNKATKTLLDRHYKCRKARLTASIVADIYLDYIKISVLIIIHNYN